MRVAEEESQLDRIERKLDELLHILGAGNSKTDAELSRRAKLIIAEWVPKKRGSKISKSAVR
jgi:hypothetical protein